jgi:hypothetical protein
MKRGIYLVANKKSEEMCENLIYSIRSSGCALPIRLMHFGGKKISSTYVISQVELLQYEDFPSHQKKLIDALLTALPNYKPGLLYRYLGWFSDWDEFLYSDNDIVALTDWTELFKYLDEFNFVHADWEYKTNGKYDFDKPEKLKSFFGDNCLYSALTSGHLLVRKNDQMINDIYKAVEWFKQNPDIPKKNDQSLMHVASLIGNWRKLNLCQPPYNWLSSWAGDYKNALEIIQNVQIGKARISHIHYSGSSPRGNLAIQDLLLAMNNDRKRLAKLFTVGLRSFSGYEQLRYQYLRARRFLKRKMRKTIFST